MTDILQGFENICDKDILQTNLTSMALFIGIYEHLEDTVLEHVEFLLCEEAHVNEKGKWKYKYSEEYIERIKKRIVDEQGNKNELKATMLWFVDEGAITQDDYATFLKLKALRHSFAHEMTKHFWEGPREENALAIVQLMELYRKIEKWWINEIEIPTTKDFPLDDYDREGVTSMALFTFEMMLNVLYGDKSEEYLALIRDLRQEDKEVLS